MFCCMLKVLMTCLVDLFGQLSDSSNHLSRKVMGILLHDIMQVEKLIIFLDCIFMLHWYI